jgi:hypothetical protein
LDRSFEHYKKKCLNIATKYQVALVFDDFVPNVKAPERWTAFFPHTYDDTDQFNQDIGVNQVGEFNTNNPAKNYRRTTDFFYALVSFSSRLCELGKQSNFFIQTSRNPSNVHQYSSSSVKEPS